jgi:hypothetical protein
MSERKTEEIKFRIEPSVKARWQAAADAAGEGLSEFIRSTTETGILQLESWEEQNANLDGLVLTSNVILAPTKNDWEFATGPRCTVENSMDCAGVDGECACRETATHPIPEPTHVPKSWMFEAQGE